MSSLQPYPVSEANSTDTPLAAGQTWRGTGEQVSDAGSMSVSVFSDAASAIGGLRVESSSDGSTWHVIAKETALGGELTQIDIPVRLRWTRVVYENFQDAQSVFLLQTVYRARPAHSALPTSPIPVRVSDGSDFVAVGEGERGLLERVLEAQSRQCKLTEITNLYLSHIWGEQFTEEDLDHGEN